MASPCRFSVCFLAHCDICQASVDSLAVLYLATIQVYSSSNDNKIDLGTGIWDTPHSGSPQRCCLHYFYSCRSLRLVLKSRFCSHVAAWYDCVQWRFQKILAGKKSGVCARTCRWWPSTHIAPHRINPSYWNSHCSPFGKWSVTFNFQQTSWFL